MTTPNSARRVAYIAAARALEAARVANLPLRLAYVAVDAVWPLIFAAGVEEGLRQSRALDPEVAEVVADTIKKFEGRSR